MKHTPGPWNAVKVRTSFDITADIPLIAHVFTQDDDSQAGNAALIAAAPDLLEALEAALHRLEQYNYQAMEPQIEKARAAIKKARGE